MALVFRKQFLKSFFSTVSKCTKNSTSKKNLIPDYVTPTQCHTNTWGWALILMLIFSHNAKSRYYVIISYLLLEFSLALLYIYAPNYITNTYTDL